MKHVRVGISTCPNDTFAFAGLLRGAVEMPGLELAFELADVEQLNRRMLAGEFDVAKVSFAAVLQRPGEYVVLPSGSALGFGVGPVVLAGPGPVPALDDPAARVLAPGAHTTASLLWRSFHPGGATPRQVVFSEIQPALAAGRADLGISIHEGRFSFRAQGLQLVEDLGRRWERETGSPLPLGGIVGRRDLDHELLEGVQQALARSLAWAEQHADLALATMRAHAQEQADDVLWAHVELYVGDRTRDLGAEGRRALERLAALAVRTGCAPDGARFEFL